MSEDEKKPKQEILGTLAPCGLNCRKCFAYNEGEIKLLSKRLKKLLGNFDKYAERFSRFLPEFDNYPSFKKLLDFFAHGNCIGCRNGTCKYPDCGVFHCYKEKGVEFCFQCEEFPCDKTNFDLDLHQRWIEMNMRMKKIGIQKYFEESKRNPRYK